MHVVQLDELRIVGIKVEAPFDELGRRVPHAWRDLEERLDEIGQLATRSHFYGVFPMRVHLPPPPELFVYWVGAHVSEFEVVPAGMEALELPAQFYVVGTCKGGPEQIRQGYVELADWIEERGYGREADDLGFELYDVYRQGPFGAPTEFDYDVYQPVRLPEGESVGG